MRAGTNLVLIIFFFTSLVSALCSIGVFFSIDQVFHSASLLAGSLSVRTLSTALFGYRANILIEKCGIRLSFMLSQMAALITVLILWVGFHYQIKLIVFFGVIVMGLPLTLTTILLTIIFRTHHSDAQDFRRQSGLREFVFGLGRLSACMLTPVFLLKTHLNVIFIFFSFGCILNLLLIPILNFKDKGVLQLDNVIHFNYQALTKPATWLYVMKLFPAYILVSFVALVASSNQLSFTHNMASYQHQMLWALEALMMMLGSFIYLRYKKLSHEYIEPLLILNSILLVPLLWETSLTVLSLVIMLTSLLLYFAYYQFRDDYILSAGSSKQFVEIYAGFSIFFRDLVCTVSPILLSILFLHCALAVAISIIFLIQLFFYAITHAAQFYLRRQLVEVL